MHYLAWKRRRFRGGGLLMVLGVGLVIAGSALAWGATALLGFTVGSAGLLAIVGGALMVRQSVAGPFPAQLEGVPDVGVDEE